MADYLVDMDSIEITLERVLTQYSAELQGDITQRTKKVAKQAAQKLRVSSPKDRGIYAKSWRIKSVHQKGEVSETVYNTLGGLTHLLENGHALHTGGRSPAVVHIAPIEDWACAELAEEIEEAISGG